MQAARAPGSGLPDSDNNCIDLLSDGSDHEHDGTQRGAALYNQPTPGAGSAGSSSCGGGGGGGASGGGGAPGGGGQQPTPLPDLARARAHDAKEEQGRKLRLAPVHPGYAGCDSEGSAAEEDQEEDDSPV